MSLAYDSSDAFALESHSEILATATSPEGCLLAARTMAREEGWEEGTVVYVSRPDRMRGDQVILGWIVPYRWEGGVLRALPQV